MFFLSNRTYPNAEPNKLSKLNIREQIQNHLSIYYGITMVSNATTPQEYIEQLPDDRKSN